MFAIRGASDFLFEYSGGDEGTVAGLREMQAIGLGQIQPAKPAFWDDVLRASVRQSVPSILDTRARGLAN